MTSGRTRFGLSGLKLVLFISLCLNVVLASYVATQWLKPRLPFGGAAAPARLIDTIAARLPPADAARLHRIFESKSEALAAAQAAYNQVLRLALQELAEPQFDAARFRAAVQEARDKRVALGDIVIDTVVEATADIPAKTRAELVGQLKPH